MTRSRSTRTVLHVDDDPAVRRAVARMLEVGGFRVLAEADGLAGLAAARRARPDLVILDVDLPALSGFEVCVRLRADPVTRRVPILHLSGARIEVRDRVQGFEGGADAYLVQPVSAEELVAVAQALVARGSRRSEGRRRSSGAREAAGVREHAVQLVAQLLRAPLSAIAINAAGLVRSSLDPVLRARARTVADAHETAARALSDLGELAYLESRDALLPLEARTPRQLVDAAVARIRRGPVGAVALSLEVPSAPALRCDPGRLERALAALLVRAIRTAAPGTTIAIAARAEGDDIHFCVEGGASATEVDQDLLDASFWSARVRRQDPQVPELSLVRAVIHAHRGRIWFDRDRPAVHVTMPTSPITAR